MAIALTKLLSRIAPETETVVEKTRQRFNQSVRQVLRAETRLQLSNVVTGADGEERETRSVRVFVMPGMPEELESLLFDDDLRLAIELAPLRSILETAHASMLELLPPITRLSKQEDFDSRFPEAVGTVLATRDLTAGLLAEASKFDLLEKIFAINEDVLGLYSYRLPASRSMFDDDAPPNVRVDLYWCVIGLIAKILGVSVEALTVKVLAHELAHAYTHIGADADGKRWDAFAFAETDRALKEGLAQYYTVRVLDRLDRQIPSARTAYEKLLPHQPEIYRTHVPWLTEHTPEEVRDAMLTMRRLGVGTVDEFAEALGDARARLRRN